MYLVCVGYTAGYLVRKSADGKEGKEAEKGNDY